MAKPKKKARRIARPARSTSRRARKSKDVVAGPGHNLTWIRKAIVPFFKRYNNLLNEKDSLNAGFMADARVLIEDAANALGAEKSIVRMALQDKRRDLKREQKERDMDPANVEVLHTFQAALGVMSDLPLGLAAVERKKRELTEDNQDEVTDKELAEHAGSDNPDDDLTPEPERSFAA